MREAEDGDRRRLALRHTTVGESSIRPMMARPRWRDEWFGYEVYPLSETSRREIDGPDVEPLVLAPGNGGQAGHRARVEGGQPRHQLLQLASGVRRQPALGVA